MEEGLEPASLTVLDSTTAATRDQQPSIPPFRGFATSLRGAAGARLWHVHARKRACDDRRFDRARHQLLDRLSEVPVTRARRLCGDLALVAVSVVLGLGRRARRPA